MTKAALVAALLLLAVPAAFAHPAPQPREYEARLLHDCVDDYFGGDAAGQGSHDVIAVDVSEGRDAALGDVLVFRLLLNGGSPSASAAVKDTLTFDAKGESRSFEASTTDNQAFTTTFDRVDGPFEIAKDDGTDDGTRFAIEGVVRASAVGVAAGDRISSFRFDSFRGATRGDFMPGTFDSAVGPVPDSVGCSQGGNTERPDYTLRGPSYYLSLAGDPASVEAEVGTEAVLQVTLRNRLQGTGQQVAFALSPTGVARFHDPTTGAVSDTLDLAVAANGQKIVHIVLESSTPSEGVLRVSATSGLGGATALDVPYAFTSGGPASTTPASSTSDGTGGGNGAPGPALPFLLGALAVALMLRRRS
ncbi:MAG TPA: hypothetical protein VI796_00910 [Candidatus Thermoplasmatota archaeon]|nr:hypothetical protein [Candidatus Thermoplasmatota archaeon]